MLQAIAYTNMQEHAWYTLHPKNLKLSLQSYLSLTLKHIINQVMLSRHLNVNTYRSWSLPNKHREEESGKLFLLLQLPAQPCYWNTPLHCEMAFKTSFGQKELQFYCSTMIHMLMLETKESSVSSDLNAPVYGPVEIIFLRLICTAQQVSIVWIEHPPVYIARLEYGL